MSQAAAIQTKPILESRDLRQIADHLEQLCIESHQHRVKTIACEGCKAKATKLRDYAGQLDQARREFWSAKDFPPVEEL